VENLFLSFQRIWLQNLIFLFFLPQKIVIFALAILCSPDIAQGAWHDHHQP
ncbi:hypothetical protein ACJX0J_034874, partial [Zea mays]